MSFQLFSSVVTYRAIRILQAACSIKKHIIPKFTKILMKLKKHCQVQHSINHYKIWDCIFWQRCTSGIQFSKKNIVYYLDRCTASNAYLVYQIQKIIKNKNHALNEDNHFENRLDTFIFINVSIHAIKTVSTGFEKCTAKALQSISQL